MNHLDLDLLAELRFRSRSSSVILTPRSIEDFGARIPPGVATICLQYPSFRQRVRGCNTKWNFFLFGIQRIK